MYYLRVDEAFLRISSSLLPPPSSSLFFPLTFSSSTLLQMPLPVAFIVAAIATSISILISTTQYSGLLSEERLRQSGFMMFQPDKFQGSKKTHRYFEGWYYKFVSSHRSAESTVKSIKAFSMVVVPGIFLGEAINSSESHAFIFVTLNGQRQHYYRFPIHEFSYANSSEEFYIQVGDNHFSNKGVSLKLYPRYGDDADLIMDGSVTFHNPSPWPVSLLSLGAMGPVGWMPGLECTH